MGNTINTWLRLVKTHDGYFNNQLLYILYRPISIFNCNPLPVQSHFSLPFGIFSIWIRIPSDKREFVLSFCLCFDFD